ncbi:MAG: restriction endonuclease subunit S [Nanoarchaeota archaeon]|nr:restriction endonuclease subunit S [Nanoarchaeota archaeon]
MKNVNTLMQPNLSINDLKNLSVPCPSLNIQYNILNDLDSFSQKTKSLQQIYTKNYQA